jgi:Protein of unknown function (DUF3467)
MAAAEAVARLDQGGIARWRVTSGEDDPTTTAMFLAVSDQGNVGGERRLMITIPSNPIEVGAWSNVAMVWHSEYEFTIDFLRADFAQQQPDGTIPGVLVSKVHLSPLMVTQLIDALTTNWQSYASKAMPPEVRDDPAHE